MSTLTTENIEELSKYTMSFTTQLGNLVSKALNMNGIGLVKAAAMYPITLQSKAAKVGWEMNLELKIAIVLYVYSEAYNVEISTGFWKKILPRKNNRYQEHIAVAKFVEPIFMDYKDTEIFREYLNRLIKEMKQQ